VDIVSLYWPKYWLEKVSPWLHIHYQIEPTVQWFWSCLVFLVYKYDSLKQILSYRLGTVNDFHWRVKPVFHNWKLHTYFTLIGHENKIKIMTLATQATDNMNRMIGKYIHCKTWGKSQHKHFMQFIDVWPGISRSKPFLSTYCIT